MVAAEPAGGLTGIGLAAQPDAGEDECGGPALGPRAQQLDVRGIEVDPGTLDEQLSRLGGGEREIARAKLGECVGRPESRKPQSGIGARDEDQLRRAR